MYFFEFEYELDKDDLSYIWQNIAPRNYKKDEKKDAVPLLTNLQKMNFYHQRTS